MATIYQWRYVANNLIMYKEQKYRYSCFAACLQIAMKNMGFSPITASEVEDSYNTYFNACTGSDLDTQAPGRVFITDFFGGYPAISNLQRYMVDVYQYPNQILALMQQYLNNRFAAVIGGINNNAGHAVMILKTPSGYFFVDPQADSVTQAMHQCNPQLYPTQQAILFQNYCAMEYMYMLTF